ncbi:MAG: DNA primase [candidate division KSB1 bacterium]|nr:DNA primase [candidate division KSB1 bacterium]MDZ7273866.1 DNA primase [candidate division KSB1 bacterium]MDZ7286022.1 DNA primase [candidate division KSB1 bacterium]MDZ7299054.1 DNA primase [candidate division KSB1 bacterium]MDZ7308191.1 DNA primase [candidate division KSB1 bacterium]
MPTLPPHIIDEVRLATDVVDLISEYVTLKKAGRNYFGLCPFHPEKTPSFSVNPDKQIFHCFGCGAGGNAFTFIQKLEGVGFAEAVRKLAQRARIAIPEPEPEDRAASQEKEGLYFANALAAEFFQLILASSKGAAGREYMRQRGFDEEALRLFGVGFAPDDWEELYKYARQKSVNPELLVKAGLLNPRAKDGKMAGYYDRFRNRVMFPIHNLSDRVVAFGGRRIPPEREDSPKYLNSPETAVYHKGQILYGLPLAREHLRAADCLIVVEGYLDVMRMHLCGFKNTVATSGTALTAQQARLILRYTRNVILLFDSDAAGSAATLRGADILVENGLQVRVATLSAGDDPDSFLRRHPAGAMQEILANAPDLLEFKARAPGQAGAASTAREEQLRSIVTTLARMNDALQRQMMVHRMAEKLQVSEAALWEEVGRLRRSQSRQARGGAAAVSQPNPQAVLGAPRTFAERSRAVEMELLRIMVLNWNAIQFIFSFMRVEDFHDPQARTMAQVFYNLLDRHLPVEPEMLLHHFNEPWQTEFISKVITQEAGRIHKEGIEIDYRRWSADCMARLQRYMIEDQRQALLEQIKLGDRSGRDVTELMQQLNEYDQQLRRIKPENFLLAA